MAYLGGIYLGGPELTIKAEDVCSSAIAFDLNKPSEIDETIFQDNHNWEIVLKSGRNSIVARSRNILPRDEILKKGFIFCQKVLDFISVSRKGNFIIKSPGYSYILLFTQNSDIILTHSAISDFPMGVQGDVQVFDNKGNIISPPLPSLPDWTHAFRYYRLSQASLDLFEAYRNLYLAFEAILQTICPKRGKEKVKRWLRRALNEVNNIIPLSLVYPGTTDPIKSFISSQYDNIRNKLFHGRSSKNIILYEDINPSEVSIGFEELIRLFQEIARKYFKVTTKGGVVTYEGFNAMMDILHDKIQFYFSDDPTPPTREDHEISPKNLNIYFCPESHYLGETAPGHASFNGKADGDYIKGIPIIHRICTKLEKNLFSVSFIKDGLRPSAIDKFETTMVIRLINKFQPRTVF